VRDIPFEVGWSASIEDVDDRAAVARARPRGLARTETLVHVEDVREGVERPSM
jgi:hypothetical protein